MSREFYHLTNPDALPSILESGLLPLVGARCNAIKHKVGPAIFACATLEDAERLASCCEWATMHPNGSWVIKFETDEDPSENDDRTSIDGGFYVLRKPVLAERVSKVCYLTVEPPSSRSERFGTPRRWEAPP